MGCGGCGKNKPKQNNSTIRVYRDAQTSQSGVRSQPIVAKSMNQRKCPKCSWPMSSVRRFSSGQRINAWNCLNKNCRHRE